MDNNFKGFQDKAVVVGDKNLSIEVENTDESIVVTYPTVATVNTTFIELEKAKHHAQNFADGHNVRLQIDCDLPELLERFKAMEDQLHSVWNLRSLIQYPEPPKTKPEHYDEGTAIAAMLSNIQTLLQTKTVVE